MNTKRLLLTALLLGTILSALTATAVIASTNGIAYNEQQGDQDRVRDCDERASQNGSTCSTECNGEASMSQNRYRYQYRHCTNQGD